MIGDLKPYSATKESGVPWLGRIPEHWQIQPAFAAYSPKLVKNTGLAEKTVLSLSYGQIVIKPEEKLHGLIPESFETYQIIDPGDIIIRTTDLQNDQTSLRIGISRHRGIITSAYLCLRTREMFSSEYGYLVLNAYDLLKVLYGYGSGLRQNLDFSDIKRMPIPVPPPSEQIAIGRFIDHVDRRIRKYIRAKQKLIKLLEEQKQAIIQRAVTRGLVPSVPLKPSGIPWLGDIPQTWEVRRLKFVASDIVDCLHATPPYSETGTHPAIRTADISAGVVHLLKAKRISASDYTRWTERLQPIEGDILYSREGERFGIAACVPAGVQLCISQRMMLFRIPSQHCSRFVMWLLNSEATYGQVLQDVMGATSPHINVSTIRNFYLAMPAVREQKKIADHIESETRSSNGALGRIEREIELLREYRMRLIADVVTGKLDVREAAERLAEEAPATETVEVADATAEMEQDDVETEIESVPEEAEA